MRKQTVSFRPEAGKDAIDVSCSLPESVAEATKVWGEEAVLNLITRAAVVDIQSQDRAMYNRQENPVRDPAKISAENEKYRPGVRQQRQSAVEKLKTNVSKLSPEEKRQLLAALKTETETKTHAHAG